MHAGWFGNTDVSGCEVVGPSAMVNPANNLKVRELSSDEVFEHIEDFVRAAGRAVEAGFDAVQVHGAHGWFVSAFLSPATNLRQDDLGRHTGETGEFHHPRRPGDTTNHRAGFPHIDQAGTQRLPS
jgi:NADPH2 dehydrogenase